MQTKRFIHCCPSAKKEKRSNWPRLSLQPETRTLIATETSLEHTMAENHSCNINLPISAVRRRSRINAKRWKRNGPIPHLHQRAWRVALNREVFIAASLERRLSTCCAWPTREDNSNNLTRASAPSARPVRHLAIQQFSFRATFLHVSRSDRSLAIDAMFERYYCWIDTPKILSIYGGMRITCESILDSAICQSKTSIRSIEFIARRVKK